MDDHDDSKIEYFQFVVLQIFYFMDFNPDLNLS